MFIYLKVVISMPFKVLIIFWCGLVSARCLWLIKANYRGVAGIFISDY